MIESGYVFSNLAVPPVKVKTKSALSSAPVPFDFAKTSSLKVILTSELLGDIEVVLK